MEIVMKVIPLVLSFAAVLLAAHGPAMAEDTLKVAVSQRGAWDTAIPEIANRVGIFKKHDIAVELLFTGGGAEALGAIISGAIDLSVAAGPSTVLGSFSKGAPLRIFGAESTGQPDI